METPQAKTELRLFVKDKSASYSDKIKSKTLISFVVFLGLMEVYDPIIRKHLQTFGYILKRKIEMTWDLEFISVQRD
jgi:hypothetical protein